MSGALTYTFLPGQTRICRDITIVDDNVVEDLNENFVLVIDSVSPDVVDPTGGDTPTATVTIRDDDGKLENSIELAIAHKIETT